MPEITEKIEVIDAHGKHLFWADEDHARRLIKNQQVAVRGTRRKVRKLIAVTEIRREKETPGHLGGTKYSHNHDTPENPQGCWTFFPVTDLHKPQLIA